MVDLTKTVKYSNPQQGEEDFIFKVINYNENTQRVLIQSVNCNFTIKPTELVSINDIINN